MRLSTIPDAISLRLKIARLLSLSLLVSATTCSSAPNETFYVVVSPDRAQAFVSDMSDIAERHGLASTSGTATDDRGRTNHVLEAKGRGLRVFVQNVPTSQFRKTSDCEKFDESGPDPGQFMVTISHQFSFRSVPPSQARSELTNDLTIAGYLVRGDPKVCDVSGLGELGN